MNIWLNGEEKETEAITIAELMRSLHFASGSVLIEHNGLALRPDEWALRSLNPGDRVECVKVVAGG